MADEKAIGSVNKILKELDEKGYCIYELSTGLPYEEIFEILENEQHCKIEKFLQCDDWNKCSSGNHLSTCKYYLHVTYAKFSEPYMAMVKARG